MTDEQARIIAKAIRDGFSDLGDRIAQGTNPENVAMSLEHVSDSISSIEGMMERFIEEGAGAIDVRILTDDSYKIGGG